MKNLKFISVIALFLVISCSLNLGEEAVQNSNESNRAAETPVVENPLKADDERSDTPVFPADDKDENKKEIAAGAKTGCANLKRAEMKLDKKQTFPVDFAPFKNSCFAAFHEPDFEDPPLGEKFFIYRDGAEIFEFPDQSQAAGYTIEAVAFEDLNGDDLTDIIIAGSVGAKFGTVYSNHVYVNTGRDFTTDREANMKLDDFTKISEIKNFVKKNPRIFFP